ncbi:MAG TPA: hypothetical protein VKM72_17490 [Thermoanaerobaculia bacterium]|nr:hypothetical protein [Thermoanaerobaculia bacterium]
MSKNLTRRVVVLLLLVTFTAGAAQAAPWSRGGGSEMSLGAALWEWIGSWVEPLQPAAVWTEGCGMDPNGSCHNGGGTDPNGAAGDGGAVVNPNG